nr:Chain C, GLY-SER-GLN-LYS-LEU-THR-THR-GLY-ASN-CYS-ASN-TRP [Equine infectious anemia virus]4ZUW_C Chain C, GLY-SER-GLN-LYS-LEU-THR-THR-GLY-ASN-CYS-ASN-TRP [Equine infectious anemia virus]
GSQKLTTGNCNW